MPSERYKPHGHASHLMSVWCLSEAPCLFIVHHGTHATNFSFEVNILKSSRLHDSFSKGLKKVRCHCFVNFQRKE